MIYPESRHRDPRFISPCVASLRAEAEGNQPGWFRGDGGGMSVKHIGLSCLLVALCGLEAAHAQQRLTPGPGGIDVLQQYTPGQSSASAFDPMNATVPSGAP